MDAWKIKIFIKGCMNYGIFRRLNVDKQELICFYKECLAMARYLEDSITVLELNFLLGALFEEMHRFPEALTFYEEAQKDAVKGGFKQLEASILPSIGIVYHSLGKYRKAIRYYENGLQIATQMCHKDTEGLIYVKLGNAYMSLLKYQEAIEYYEKSLNITIEVGNKEREEITYSKLGNAYSSLGKYHEAIEYEEKCLRIAIEIGDKKGEGTTYMILGDAYKSLSKYHEAIEYYGKALNITLEIGDKKGEGNTYIGLGRAYKSLGKYNEAIRYGEKGLRIAMALGNKERVGNTYMNLGSAYMPLGKHHEALEYFEKSVRIAIEIGDKKEEGHLHMNIGSVYASLGKYHEAIEYHEKSLNIAIEIGDKKGEGYSYTNLGDVYKSLSKYHECIKYEEKGLRIAIEMGDKEVEGSAYIILANAYQHFSKYHEAINYYKKGLNIAIEIGDKYAEAIAYSNIGALHHTLSMINESTQDKEISQKTLHESAHFLKEAIRCWDWLFDHLQEQDNFKISIADTFITTYKLLTTVLINTRQTEESLLVCDRGRARALGDILVSKYRLTKGHAYTAPLEHRADIEIISSNCNFCILFFALLNQKGLCIWVSTHRNPLYFIVCENECFNNPMQTLLFNNCVVNDAYDKMKIGKAVRCENRSLEILKMPQQFECDNQDTADESALFSAERNINEVKDNRGESNQYTDPLETLFNVLIAPALQNLEQEEIVIIPDGYLYTVPFAALRDPNTGLFLSETKRIRIAPSLVTLKVLQECSIESHCKKGALIIGNPEVGEVMFEGEKTTISSLPSAEREAKVIGDILNVKPVIGSEASKEIIKQKLREGVALIHIAAHGSSEGGQIALAPPPQTEAGRVPEEQDYMLTMQDVQESGVRAQLVVLSCCHSGRGEIKAEGVVGMSRAFLAAGARAVVASLWAIDDKATLNFMVSFYMYLKMGESASKSLQQAMKEMREDGYDEPRHWAPFFLIGDDVTIIV